MEGENSLNLSDSSVNISLGQIYLNSFTSACSGGNEPLMFLVYLPKAKHFAFFSRTLTNKAYGKQRPLDISQFNNFIFCIFVKGNLLP